MFELSPLLLQSKLLDFVQKVCLVLIEARELVPELVKLSFELLLLVANAADDVLHLLEVLAEVSDLVLLLLYSNGSKKDVLDAGLQ